tara:strand:+ start:701 stop:1468 length:768 start_codon:yes stop_codon:yes gene_type:complete
MKKKDLLVSVITPNYNGERYLEETIKSVINQSYKKIEFIVIDGKSKDNSLKIIKKYRKKINYFESKKDNNIFHAVDKGIRKSKGEIIIWINSDDMLHPDAAKNVVKIFKNYPKIKWINGVCGYIKFNIKFFFIPYIYPKKIILKGKAHKKFWGYIQQESTSFRRSLYIKSGGLDTLKGSAGDYNLWQKFAKLSKLNTFFIKIGYFRSHPNQLSAKKNEYEMFTGNISSKFNLNLRRLFLSLMMLPVIWFKTINLK